jgi:hypothetical protein
MRSLADVLRRLAPAVLTACAAASALTTYASFSGGGPLAVPADVRETAQHLTALRRAVPKEARVVVVTPRVPALDFDFWFGLARPVKILVPFSESLSLPEGSPLTAAGVRAELQRRGALFTKESFLASLAAADYAVFDGAEFAREAGAWAEPPLTHVLTSGGVSLYRAAGR